jgi:hypothetical protein
VHCTRERIKTGKKNDEDSVIKRRKLRIKTAVMGPESTFDDASASFFFSVGTVKNPQCTAHGKESKQEKKMMKTPSSREENWGYTRL